VVAPDLEVIVSPGVLVEVLGQGVLLQGKSGIGKSDLALGLVDRGHRFVVDDAIELFKGIDGRLFGRPSEDFAGFMEVRGLGVINLAQIYGEQVVLRQAAIDLVLSLFHPAEDYWQQTDRLRCHMQACNMMGITVSNIKLPYLSGRDMPLLIETLVRLNIARQQGYDAVSDFEARLSEIMDRGAA
jgi:HPr kinase/phosphorylase